MPVTAMLSPICFQLWQIYSSSSPLLLALQGCQGAHMIPAGKRFPSRHKLGCPKQPQTSQLYNWSGCIPPGQCLHTRSLHHPAPTEMGCPIQGCPVPSAVEAAGPSSPQTCLGDCCLSPLAWDSLLYPLHTHPSTGTCVLHFPPSLSPFWYVAFLGVVIPAKGALWKWEQGTLRAIPKGIQTMPGPDRDQ